MKVKSLNPEITNIAKPQDKAKPTELEKANRNAESLSGVGSVKSKFEMAPNQTALDKMIDGKVREHLGNTKQKLSPDQFSMNGKGQVVVQNQAETLLTQNQAETLNEKTVAENHIWMNAATKKVFSKSSEGEAFVIDNRGVRKIIDREDLTKRKLSLDIVSDQIIDHQDLSSGNQIVDPEDKTASKK